MEKYRGSTHEKDTLETKKNEYELAQNFFKLALSIRSIVSELGESFNNGKITSDQIEIAANSVESEILAKACEILDISQKAKMYAVSDGMDNPDHYKE